MRDDKDEHGDCCKNREHPHTPVKAPAAAGKYTCPMHPEVFSDKPGVCPKCGMPLEPKSVAGEGGEDDSEIRSLTRKFWIALVLTLPVFFLAMAHMIPGLHLEALIPKSVSKWVEFALATPVVLWAGGIFLHPRHQRRARHGPPRQPWLCAHAQRGCDRAFRPGPRRHAGVDRGVSGVSRD